MARILIVEDESFFANALTKILHELGHSFVVAGNGKVARGTLEHEDFDCIISDSKMPYMTGAELAAWVGTNKPTPFIITTSYAEPTDPERPFGLVGVTLLIKPFTKEGVGLSLSRAMPGGVAGVRRDSPQTLVPAPKSIARKAGIAEINFYRNTAGHSKLLVRKGDPFIYDRLGLGPNEPLYTDRESLDGLLASSFLIAKGAAGNTKVDPNRRTSIMQTSIQIIHEQVNALGLDPAAVDMAVDTIATFMKSVEEGAVWDMITNLDTYSRPIYAQTLAVTTVGLLIAQEQQMSTQDSFKLTAAALFHDIGYITLDPNLVKTPRVLLNMRDRAALEKHVEVGVALLQKSGFVASEVCTIVWQHHESDAGGGYPRNLKHAQIHPMARLLRVVDDFCLSVMKSGGQPGLPPLKALELLKGKRELDPKYVVALQRVLTAATKTPAL